jgi:hypothetical protein
MKNILLALLFLFFLCSCSRDKKMGFEYISEKGNFSIEFPGMPSESKQENMTKKGMVQVYNYSFMRKSKEIFLLSYFDYPKAAMQELEEEEILKSSMEGSLEIYKGKVKDIEKTSIEGYPALRFRVRSSPYHLHQVSVLVERRLYQIIVMKLMAHPDKEDVENFVSSFRILQKDLSDPS